MKRSLLPPASSWALGAAAMLVVVRGVVATAAVVVVVAAAVLPGATAVMVGKMVGREGAGTLAGGAAGEAREAAGAGRVALAVEAMECSTLPSMWSRHPDSLHNWRPMSTSSRTELRVLEGGSAALMAGPGAMAAAAARGARAAHPVVREATEEAGAMRAEVSVGLVAGAARVGASAGLAGLAVGDSTYMIKRSGNGSFRGVASSSTRGSG